MTSRQQLEIKPFSPRSRGLNNPVDDRKLLCRIRIIHVLRHDLPWLEPCL